MKSPNAPHQGQPLHHRGQPIKDAGAAMIMIHGRGADGQSLLSLVTEFNNPHYAYLAPDAANHTWYPFRFLAPVERNEPGISSGMQVIGDLLDDLAQKGIPAEKVILLGFSQGACLTLEFAARNARRFGGVAALSGGLIGPDEVLRDYQGSLDGTPVFLGCSDVDSHIPARRVSESAEILEKLGGVVTARLYRGMGHTINQDEVRFVSDMMSDLV